MIFKRIKNKIKYICNYGIIFSLKYTIYSRKNLFFEKNKLVEEKIEKIFLNKEYENNKEKLFKPKIDTNLYKGKIWVLWWQGLDEAPSIVKLCINSMKKNIEKKEIVIITKNNFEKYINLPQFIIEKFNNGNISIQHFSDIIRFYLLYYYGGLWLDATILMKDKLDNNIFDYKFYSIKREKKDERYIAGYRWTGFVLASKPQNILFKYLLNMQLIYWKKYTIIIDYVLFDYFINYLYENYNEIKRMIDDIPINNIHVDDLFDVLNMSYNENIIRELRKNTYLYKLNWKKFIDYEKHNTIYKKFVENNE